MSSVFLVLTMVLYFASTVCYLAYLLRRAETLSKVSLGITAVGFATHTVALVAKMANAGQTQLPTFHEALSFFSWMLILVFLAVEFRRQLHVLGSFIVPLALVSLVTAAAFRSDGAASLQPDYRSRAITPPGPRDRHAAGSALPAADFPAPPVFLALRPARSCDSTQRR